MCKKRHESAPCDAGIRRRRRGMVRLTIQPVGHLANLVGCWGELATHVRTNRTFLPHAPSFGRSIIRCDPRNERLGPESRMSWYKSNWLRDTYSLRAHLIAFGIALLVPVTIVAWLL